MKKILAICLICLSFISCSSSGNSKIKGYHLVWSDEFNGREIDSTKWDFQLGNGSLYGLTDWGNNEQEYYTKDNAYIEKGNLILEARKESKEEKPYTSSRVRTIKDDGTVLFSKTYGRIEARIKLPKGNGLWPAFWLLPATDDYGVWASSGEIDILEAKGRLANRTYGTVHFGQAWPGNKYSGGMYKFPDDTDISEYHVYALEWEPGLLRWLVDDKVFYETKQWWSMGKDASEPYKYPAPFDKPFYIVLNLAVGGNFDSNVIPEDYDLPAKMYVDYVRVYDKDEPYATNVKRPTPQRDSSSFNSFEKNSDGGFIFDKDLSECRNDAMLQNEMDVKSHGWYFLALTEFGAKAESNQEELEEKSFRHVKISEIGIQNYSVQLIQHLPVAEGYSYKIEFDAKSTNARNITVKLGVDADNSWSVYSPEYHPELTTEIKHYSYFFTMENATDSTARLEFNLGLNSNDVWIGNVTVTQEDL